MTGSTFLIRQHSSTSGYSNVDKMEQPKLRRWSSVDTPNLLEVLSDDENKTEENLSFQRNQTFSDVDSGVEDSGDQNGNDDESVGDFEASPNECIEETSSTPVPTEQYLNEDNYADLIELASRVTDIEKKEFCDDTRIVFHAECARQIDFIVNSIDPRYRYFLFAQDEVDSDACYWPGFDFVKVDNAKAQYRCPNTCCGRLWTSARARILFKISRPQPCGFIVLKILEQICENCGALADALWYMEEVCRVMKNLSDTILSVYFPQTITNHKLENTNVKRSFRRKRHDPNQREANMHAQHNRDLCVACQLNVCFA